jgi:secondary thiamine-phosphate synthase enzyme
MNSNLFGLDTPHHACMIDITSQVQKAVEESGLACGLVHVFSPHTTAAITINENADPDVVTDMLRQLEQMVPWSQPFFDHDEGNSAAHVKSSMVGCSETIAVAGGKLVLGMWQGIYLCEFDGPRRRSVQVTVIG